MYMCRCNNESRCGIALPLQAETQLTSVCAAYSTIEQESPLTSAASADDM